MNVLRPGWPPAVASSMFFDSIAVSLGFEAADPLGVPCCLSTAQASTCHRNPAATNVADADAIGAQY